MTHSHSHPSEPVRSSRPRPVPTPHPLETFRKAPDPKRLATEAIPPKKAPVVWAAVVIGLLILVGLVIGSFSL